MPELQEHGSQTPKASCEESQASPVREIHNVKDEILDALNGMFMGLKTAQDENSERVRDLESEIRDVQNDLREIRTSVQYVPGNLRRLGSDVHLVRNKICPEDTCRAGGDTWEEDECDCRQCERERNGAYLDENKGWGDEQDAEHKYKDEKTISEDFALVHDNSGDSWDSNLSNDKRLASSNEESGRSSSNSVNVAQHEHPVQTNQRDFPQIVDFEEPRDLATIDNHHLTGFRNALVEFQELATKFSIMPPDASGNLTIEAKNLFVDIIDKAKEFKPAATALVAFSHNHAYTIVDTADKVREMVDTLVALPTNEPNIGADFEGKELGRDGELYLVIIHDYVADHTYIVDIFHLQSAAFDTTGTDKHATLKSILESAKIPKLFWDVRQDSDAIFHHFGVKLSGILDVQLFIMAEMSKDYMYPRRKRPGLFNMLYYTLDMDLAQKNRWTWIKYHGKALWDPKQGGSFDRFTDRKKRFEIIEYCCGDVAYLRPLYRKAVRFLPDDWKEKVRIATTSSIEETWEENFESSGVWGPWQ